MNEHDVQMFWQNHPCGEGLVGGSTRFSEDFDQFFQEYDRWRYRHEGHILECLDEIGFCGRKALEIGLGQGADSEQIIRRGAVWSGVDLTPESIERVRTRLQLRRLPYCELHQASVLDLPFDDHCFDIVFSHGVLHHVPDIHKAQQEIFRVLKPSGKLVIMLYSKWSLNYLLSISILRRLGLIGLVLTRSNARGIYGQHLANVKRKGLWTYLKMQNFIHRNTDGALNPYSKVYDRATIEQDFPLFRIERSFKRFMHAPPLRVQWLPFGKYVGWHLWAYLVPVGNG